MRLNLVILLLITTLVQVSANSFGQKVTLKGNKLSMEKVFREIHRQTGYFILMENSQFKATEVNADFLNTPLNQVMDFLVKGTRLAYTIEDNTIVVNEKTPSFLDRVVAAFAAIDVRGKVLDEKGGPLVGATVVIKGTARSVKTDQQGSFYLQGVDEKDVLVISYIGYQNREVDAASDMGNLTMVLAEAKLEEVTINAGYYTITKREMTGSIARVDAKTIARQPVNNPLAALIGRMSGVNIEQQSGLNGGGFKVEIRGTNSLRNSNTDNANRPLYLIDGVPFPSSPINNSNISAAGISGLASPLNFLNPSDIESIEVLKDADATAIYGSRGANGVILIRTKTGKTDKTTLDVTVNSGIAKVSSKLKMLNTQQYLEMRNEAFKNDGVNPGLTDYDLNGAWNQERYTDWQKVLVGGIAYQTDVNTSLSGGNEFTRFGFRNNYSRIGTVIPGDFSDQKGSGALTINHRSTDQKFSINFSSTYALDNNSLPRLDLTQYINLAPNAPELYDEHENINWALNSSGTATWTNPLSILEETYNAKTNNFLASALLNYEFFPGFSFSSSLGYTSIRLRETQLKPIAASAPSASVTGLNRVVLNAIETWSIEPRLRYRRKIADGTLDVLFGSSLQKDDQRSETVIGTGYTSDFLIGSINAAPTRNAQNSSSEYKYMAFFGRINYNYKDNLFLNLTGRRDGSSRFGPDKQFANFGALGIGWIFGNEQFLKQALPLISFGKLRGSYGLTGNDQIQNYAYLETYSATNAYLDGSGLFPSRLANPNYSWETNHKAELALDLGFLNDRIFITTSFYRNRSSNQLVGYTLPVITGFPSVQYNLPATVQNTGWEFELNTSNVNQQNFSWKSSLNLSIPKNKLITYPNISASAYANSYTIGKSLYTPKTYHVYGVNQATGIYDFQDLNGNGKIDIGDRKTANQSVTSHFYGGIINSINYKNISLDVFVQFVNKTTTNWLSAAQTNLPGSLSNQPIEVLKRWKQPNDKTDVQKFSQNFVTGGAGSHFSNLSNADRFLDASYIRLKNVSISWNLPVYFLKRMKLTGLRLFFQGQNLYTLTKYIGDPEVANIRILPSLKSLTIGAQLSL